MTVFIPDEETPSTVGGPRTGARQWPVFKNVETRSLDAGNGDQACLVFSDEPRGFVSAREDLLIPFSRLHEGADDQILRFARRWGMLDPGSPLGRIDGEEVRKWVESIDTWRRRSAAFAVAHRIAVGLKAGKMCVESDAWTAIPTLDRFGHVFAKPWKQNLRGQRTVLGLTVNTWLYRSRVAVSFHWDRSPRPILRVNSGSLFGALALELALEVAGVSGIAFCYHCGTDYQPDGQLRSDRANYCQKCKGEGWPQRYATKHYRERQRAKRLARRSSRGAGR